MRRFCRATLAVASLLVLGFGTASVSRAAEERFITIGTGGQTGVYYLVG
jgi:TRAP-type uncharacterized transport system substrate-binding protein